MMEPSYARYIWTHTRRQQLWILCIVMLSMVPYYLAFDLPKLIVNGPILGEGFANGETQPFAPGQFDVPWIGTIELLPIWQLDRTDTLIALSLTFLALVVVNGLFKYYINTFKGLLGERLLRRLRYELVDRILRSRPSFFKRIKGAEVSSMVKDEVEPLGGFTGDAFVQPALLGGQALTALAFIIVQNVWLGILAGAMAGIQILIIPRLRRRLIELGRERQLTARELAGRINEIVDGIGTIHANDTSNWERADISERLGLIFRIRFDIYQWKFLVKFINNFLAQVTPFFFYLIGGWFAIKGELDVGQLVAVINAYKELPGPLKELIDWDLARQDVQVKYEQVVEQLGRGALIEARQQSLDTKHEAQEGGALSLSAVTLTDDGGNRVLDRVSLTLKPGETMAILGSSGSGGEALAEVLARTAWPDSGRVTLGEDDLFDLPESVSGRRVTYSGQDSWFFYGTLYDNLTYALNNAPLDDVVYEGEALRAKRWAMREAKKSGNPDLDRRATWLATDALNMPEGAEGQGEAIAAVLRIVRLEDQVLEFGLNSTLDAEDSPDLAERVVKLRTAFQEELGKRGLSSLVVPFVDDAYNDEAPVLDNLLFGVFTGVRHSPAWTEAQGIFFRALEQTGLSDMLCRMAVKIVDNTLDLVEDLPPDHPLFDRLGVTAEDIPRLQTLVKRATSRGVTRLPPEDRRELMEMSLRYVEPQQRFGVLSEAIRKKVVEVRAQLGAKFPERLRGLLERYREDAYLSTATLSDNIIFGKFNLRQDNAERQAREIIGRLLNADSELYRRVFELGLHYNLGASGRRLTLAQRQRLGFARALLRRSDFYVFNRSLSGMEGSLQKEVVKDALAFLAAQGRQPGVMWVLSNPALASMFARSVTFADGVIEEDTGSEEAGEGDRKPRPR